MSYVRVRAFAVIGVLSALCLALVVAAIARDTQGGATASCPREWPVADLSMREPKDTRINVLNATDVPGLADRVADDFRNRTFQVLGEMTEEKKIDGVALLRYGPKGTSSMHLLRAYFLNEAEYEYDAKRTEDTVDVVLGSRFNQLATDTDMRLSLGQLGRPTAPPQTCPSPVDK
ncbi:LytR C-terminal domain-containing protein [Micromonospora sp. NPDC005324]|uniref:LytR C-terminal domain-containing protein n=1 Tax=Micromonospora sp. NPDC005324 TaxID=3157033 RepID=UPI0033B333AB